MPGNSGENGTRSRFLGTVKAGYTAHDRVSNSIGTTILSPGATVIPSRRCLRREAKDRPGRRRVSRGTLRGTTGSPLRSGSAHAPIGSSPLRWRGRRCFDRRTEGRPGRPTERKRQRRDRRQGPEGDCDRLARAAVSLLTALPLGRGWRDRVATPRLDFSP